MAAPRILVADDDIFIRQLLDCTLSDAGYDVRLVPDGDEALAFVANHRLDLIVLDAVMPGVPGFEVLRQVKADPATRGVPVIMLTALNLTADVTRGLACGANGYVVKPFVPVAFVARVKQLLGARRYVYI